MASVEVMRENTLQKIHFSLPDVRSPILTHKFQRAHTGVALCWIISCLDTPKFIIIIIIIISIVFLNLTFDACNCHHTSRLSYVLSQKKDFFLVSIALMALRTKWAKSTIDRRIEKRERCRERCIICFRQTLSLHLLLHLLFLCGKVLCNIVEPKVTQKPLIPLTVLSVCCATHSLARYGIFSSELQE